jgi:HEAT repeat protein
MSQPSRNDTGGDCRRVNLGHPLVLVAVCLLTTWAGLRIWENWKRTDPVRVIRRGNVTERRRAAQELGVVGGDTDFETVMVALVRALKDPDGDVRAAAAESLGAVGSGLLRRPARTSAEQAWTRQQVQVATRALTASLSDAEPSVRESAISGFSLLGKASKVDLPPELLAGLKDESPSIRRATSKALGNVQLSPAAVPILIEALEGGDREIRFHATELLSRLGPDAKQAVPALLATLREPWDAEERKRSQRVGWDWDPACGAAKALGRIATSEEVIANLARMLSSDIAERTSSAAEGLGDLGPPAVAAVPSLIAAYEKVVGSRQHTIGQIRIPSALARIAPGSRSAPEALAILVRALDSGDVSVRLGAAQAVGRFGRDATRAIPKLRTLERDPVQDVRDAASGALQAIEGSSEAGDSEQTKSR